MRHGFLIVVMLSVAFTICGGSPRTASATGDSGIELAESGESAAGNGFYYKNVSFKTEYGMTEAIGEMTNRSGKSYQIAMFTMSVYDASGKLMSTCPIMIQTFAAGATKSWSTHCDDVPKSLKYKIAFDNAM